MKRAQFVLALWGVTGLAAGLQAGDCDCPKSKSCTQCQCRDDSGILDHVDKVAGQFHASFKKNFKLMSGISRLGKSDCDISPSCGCEVAPSCGCEIAPSCGCEVKPSCGCEIAPSCGCEVCGPGATSVHQTNVAPPLSHQPQRVNSQPAPNGYAPQQVPDAQVDPFVDETPRSGQSKVRGRTIQYRTNGQPVSGQPISTPTRTPSGSSRPAYGQQYNSQAHSLTPNWPDKTQPRQLQLVAPASGESQVTVEQVFSSAYRVKLSDGPEQAQPATTGLRPVPSKGNSSSGDNVSSRNVGNRVVVPKELSKDSKDPYERGEPIQLDAYENPLRR